MSSPTQGLQAGNDLVLNKSINNKLGPPDRCLRHLYELRTACENDTVVYRRELTATADGKVMDGASGHTHRKPAMRLVLPRGSVDSILSSGLSHTSAPVTTLIDIWKL